MTVKKWGNQHRSGDTGEETTTKPIHAIKLKESYEWLYEIKILHTHTV